MRKIILNLVILSFTLILTNCGEDNALNIEKNDQEIILIKESELPKNAIHASELLQKEGLINKLNYREIDPTEPITFYKKYFVLYPYDWNYEDRLKFLQLKRIELSVSIFVGLNNCMHIDTWFIEQGIRPGQQDRDKNLIVVTGSDDDIEIEEEDGPRETNDDERRNYTSCDEVPLPPIKTDIIIDNDSDNDDTGGGGNNDLNIPQK